MVRWFDRSIVRWFDRLMVWNCYLYPDNKLSLKKLNLTDMKRRKYDREYKQMVVELAKTRDDTAALAAELDLRPDIINRWKREALAYESASFPGQGNKIMTEEQKEIARLKKELRDAQIERDILKKAVNIFSRNDGKYLNS